MATDVDHSYYGWSRDEFPDPDDTQDASTAQMLDHGSISFGRFAVEPLAWEKRSVFKHNRCQEELEKFKAPGLVAQKKAFFEEYYKKIRALKALQQSQQNDNLDYGNASISSETGERVEPSIQPQSFGGGSSALSGEEPYELGSLQRTDYNFSPLNMPEDYRSIDSSPRSMEVDELENFGDSACDMEHALLGRKGEKNQNEINDVEHKSLHIQETALCDVGYERFLKKIDSEGKSSTNGSNACCIMDDKPKLTMEKSRDACSKLEVITPVRTESKLDPKRRPGVLKSSEGSKPQPRLVGNFAKLGGKAGSSIVPNKILNSSLSNRRPASSYSQRSSTVLNKTSGNRLPIDKRPASSCSPRPLPQLVGKDDKLSSTVLNNPAANRLQTNMTRPSSASSQRLPKKSVDKDEKLSGRTGDDRSFDKRPASAASQRVQLVSRTTKSEKGGRSTVANNPSAGYWTPPSATCQRSLTEERSSVTVPRPFSFATERRAATSSAKDSATQFSSRAARTSHASVLGGSGLKVQVGTKKTTVKGVQRRKANENRDSEDVRMETPTVVKHNDNRGGSSGVNNVIGTQTARSFNLPAHRMPYPTVAMQKGLGKEVLVEHKAFESTNQTSRPDRTAKSDDKKTIPSRSKEPSVSATRPLTADSSHSRRTSRKELPRWR